MQMFGGLYCGPARDTASIMHKLSELMKKKPDGTKTKLQMQINKQKNNICVNREEFRVKQTGHG